MPSLKWAERDLRGYWENRLLPEKYMLCDYFSKYEFESLLEVGCGCGQNLHLMAKRWPERFFMGVDINTNAIEYGYDGNVFLTQGDASCLDFLEDNQFDVAFTFALLCHIPSNLVRGVIKELLRVSRKVILIEPNASLFKTLRGFMLPYHKGQWIRDYVRLLREFVPKESIKISPLGIRGCEPWASLGSIIEVNDR